MKASQISHDRVEDARNAINEGEEIEMMVVSVDRKNRVIEPVYQAREIAEGKDSIEEAQKQTANAVANNSG